MPEPSVQEIRQQRERILLANLNRLDSEAASLGEYAAAFRLQNMAIVKGNTVFISLDWNERERLSKEWHLLRKRAWEVTDLRSAIMSELCRLQEQREHEQRAMVTHA